jgi:hypothetical protein
VSPEQILLLLAPGELRVRIEKKMIEKVGDAFDPETQPQESEGIK